MIDGIQGSYSNLKLVLSALTRLFRLTTAVIYVVDSTPEVIEAGLLTLGSSFSFVFSAPPTEAVFLADFPGAVKVDTINQPH